MHIRAVEVTLHLPYAQTLKDKRQVLRSLLDRIKLKFNVSAAETDAQDLCQKMVIGIACVSGNDSQARTVIDAVLRLVENNDEAVVLAVEDY